MIGKEKKNRRKEDGIDLISMSFFLADDDQWQCSSSPFRSPPWGRGKTFPKAIRATSLMSRVCSVSKSIHAIEQAQFSDIKRHAKRTKTKKRDAAAVSFFLSQTGLDLDKLLEKNQKKKKAAPRPRPPPRATPERRPERVEGSAMGTLLRRNSITLPLLRERRRRSIPLGPRLGTAAPCRLRRGMAPALVATTARRGTERRLRCIQVCFSFLFFSNRRERGKGFFFSFLFFSFSVSSLLLCISLSLF